MEHDHGERSGPPGRHAVITVVGALLLAGLAGGGMLMEPGMTLGGLLLLVGGRHDVATICQTLGLSRATLYRYVTPPTRKPPISAPWLMLIGASDRTKVQSFPGTRQTSAHDNQ